MSITRIRMQTPRRVVQGAVVAMALGACAGTARAQTTTLETLTKESVQTSTVEVGIGDVTKGSFKAGEFNGLEKKGAFFAGNFDLHDNSAYDSASALRWHLKGTDLGLETRNVSGDLRVQGTFRLFFVYDELLRNRSDSYQTPLMGAGTNVLTLPSTWLVPTVAGGSTSNSFLNNISARGLVPGYGTSPYIDPRTSSPNFGVLISPNATQTAQVNAAIAADTPLFQHVNLFTKRRSEEVGGNYSLTDQWNVAFDIRPEQRTGLKPMGTVSRNTGGDISTVIPDRIDTNTNQYTASLNFRNDEAYGSVGYYGSFFRNNVPFMSWQNWATTTLTTNTMSSTPSNDFNQINGSAGYNLSKTTKVVGSVSHSHATQNDAFLTDSSTPVVPVSSLNGLVVSTFANVRLTAHPTNKLHATAAYKFDDRDNRTAVNIYQFADAGESPSANANFPAGPNNPLGAVVAQNANANRPYSRRSNLFTSDADYALAHNQWVKAGYDFERLHRQCTGSWYNCANAGTTNENTGRVEWRMNASSVNAKVEYAYSARRTPNYDENAFLALVPYANVVPNATGVTQSAYAFMIANGWTGYGPVAGFVSTTSNPNMDKFFPSNNALANAAYANNNRISELIGMRRYYVADRNRNKVRSSLDWQATDSLSLDGQVDFNRDFYPASVYGLQKGQGWATTVDGNYAIGSKTSADAFYTYENQLQYAASNSYTANSSAVAITGAQASATGLSGNACDGYTTLQQRNNNNKIDPCLNWFTNMVTKAHTAGVGLTHKAGKAQIDGNLVFTRVRWDNTVTGGNWANNLLLGPANPPTTIAAYFIAATPTPTVTTHTVELRVHGRVEIDTHQSLHIAYAYLRMRSSDYAYDGMQIGTGTISGVLPSQEQPFNYDVNVVSAAYVMTF